MKHSATSYALIIGLALGVVVLAAGFSTQEASGVAVPTLRLNSADARYASLDALTEAWQNRPLEISESNKKAERRFLNRMISVLKQTKHTETYPQFCSLWNLCYHDHTSQYADDVMAGN